MLRPRIMKAWKMIDAEHAHLFEAGRIRIGRLEDYCRLENGRADAVDGGLEFGTLILSPEYESHRNLVRTLAPGSGFKNAYHYGTRFLYFSPPTYAVCFTEVGNIYDPNPSTPKAIFEISDLDALARRLLAHLKGRASEYVISPVRYERRRFDAWEARQNPQGMVDVFCKDKCFEPEKEIRIALRPCGSASDFARFDTPPDPLIAKLLTRVR